MVMLVLTSDAQFSMHAAHIIIPDVRFVKLSHPLKNIPLDQLTAFVLLQVLFHNKRTLRDPQVATNCLACIANLASGFENIHPHLAQSLVKLLHVSSRVYLKSSKVGHSHHHHHHDDEIDTEDAENALHQLKLAIEITSTCLGRKLHANATLVYALVHDQHLFAPLAEHSELTSLIQPILLILHFFTKAIEDTAEVSLDQRRVQAIINDNMYKFTSTTPHRTIPPVLRFTYEEGERSIQNAFFMPYVWRMILAYPSFFYPDHAIHAFSPHDSIKSEPTLYI
jgi:hypothetical protein